jgi:hypothetical protein
MKNMCPEEYEEAYLLREIKWRQNKIRGIYSCGERIVIPFSGGLIAI